MANIEIEDEILIPAKHAFEEYYNLKFRKSGLYSIPSEGRTDQ